MFTTKASYWYLLLTYSSELHFEYLYREYVTLAHLTLPTTSPPECLWRQVKITMMFEIGTRLGLMPYNRSIHSSKILYDYNKICHVRLITPNSNIYKDMQ